MKLKKEIIQEINGKRLISNKKIIEKQKKYLAEWDVIFERLVDYKKKNGITTVSKNCEDRELYIWYRKQKQIYNNPQKRLPKKHLEKLKSINFYFGDGNIEKSLQTDKKWFNIIKEAIENGEKVQTNHRYRYKGQGIGTYLVGVKKKNKEGKKLDVKEKLAKLGVVFEKTSRKPIEVVERFYVDLKKTKNPNKGLFQNKFNHQVLSKVDIIPTELKNKISELWKAKFYEERTWHIRTREKTGDEMLIFITEKLFNDNNPSYNEYKNILRYGFIQKKKFLKNDSLKDELGKIWLKKFKERIDWKHKRQKQSPEAIVKRFLDDLKNLEFKRDKQRFVTRFDRTVKCKYLAVSPIVIKEIKNAWEKRFNEKLDWIIDDVEKLPEEKALILIDNLLFDDNPDKNRYKKEIEKLVVDKRHISEKTIKKLKNIWQLRFAEKLVWFVKKDITDMDRIKQWKKFRYNTKLNPDHKWYDKPINMKSIHKWVKALKSDKKALTAIITNFTLDEAREMMREGFLVDVRPLKNRFQ